MSSAGGTGDFVGGVVGDARDRLDRDREAAGAQQLGLLDEDDPAIWRGDDLVGLPDARDLLEIQREMGGTLAQAVQEHRRRAGQGGRKKGSLNRAGQDFKRWVLQFGSHPAVGMMRLQSRPVELLAAELGCTLLEAAALQEKSRAELLPYLEGKAPVQVQVSTTGHMTLELHGVGLGASGLPIEADWTELPLSFAAEQPAAQETAENRHSSDGEGGVSE